MSLFSDWLHNLRRSFLITLLLFCCVFIIIFCQSKPTAAFSQASLFVSLPMGIPVSLKSSVNTPDAFVCTLYPYQSSVDQNYPHHVRINAHLEATAYQSAESRWSYVIITPTQVSHRTFYRSRWMDIQVPDFIVKDLAAQLPKGFMPVTCAPIANTVFLKIKSGRKVYLILGTLNDK